MANSSRILYPPCPPNILCLDYLRDVELIEHSLNGCIHTFIVGIVHVAL